MTDDETRRPIPIDDETRRQLLVSARWRCPKWCTTRVVYEPTRSIVSLLCRACGEARQFVEISDLCASLPAAIVEIQLRRARDFGCYCVGGGS